MATTFRKTAKGTEEIATRANRLAPALRHALILVDGKRSDTDLQALLPLAPGLLHQLSGQGFIEPVPGAAPAPAPALTPPGAPAAAVQDLTLLRREMVRALTDLVGPAAESAAIRIERAQSAAELRALLDAAAQLVAGMRGRGPAADFMARFAARLAPPGP